MSHNFPNIAHAMDLLKSMESHTTFKSGEPSADVVAFLDRIKNADPNSPQFTEDNTNGSWGHYQFTGGNMTCTSVLTSWTSIGNTNIACQLIAAAIKTCKVARHLCFEHEVESHSYLGDIYLANVINILWRLWSEAGGVFLLFFGFPSDLIYNFSPIGKAPRKCRPPSRQPLPSQLLPVV